jgi:hypothetical protein
VSTVARCSWHKVVSAAWPWSACLPDTMWLAKSKPMGSVSLRLAGSAASQLDTFHMHMHMHMTKVIRHACQTQARPRSSSPCSCWRCTGRQRAAQQVCDGVRLTASSSSSPVQADHRSNLIILSKLSLSTA